MEILPEKKPTKKSVKQSCGQIRSSCLKLSILMCKTHTDRCTVDENKKNPVIR